MLISDICVTVILVTLTARVHANVCIQGFSNCSQCIQMNPSCAWCSQRNIRQPCNTVEELRRTGCQVQNVVFPLSGSEIKENQSWEAKFGSHGQHTVIRPQQMDIRMRKGSTYTFDVQYRPDEHLFVDLYFLMDLTYTMRDDKETLVNLGHTLAALMSNSTAKYRLGFGSFVDKPVMPYISTVPAAVKNPCVILPGDHRCKSPYGYINHLSLTSNISKFLNEVQRAEVSGNLDNAEGVLDGLMQTIVCEDEIGWTNDSRRVVILATDNIFHYAGDGKLGGVVNINDMKCHLTKKGRYTHSTLQDYPSISQIDHVLLNSQTSVLFASTESAAHAYRAMVNILQGDARVSILESDFSNILQILKDEFKRYQSHVRLVSNETEDFEVKFYTRCHDGTETERSFCDDLVPGKEINFKVQITAKKDRKLQDQIIRINPAGISQQLMLNMSVLDSCPCESLVSPSEVNSDQCSHNGNLTCGRCYCAESWFGSNCKCNRHMEKNPLDYENKCYLEDSNVPCSGRGTCICGECECHQNYLGYPYNGTFCECDNNACLLSAEGKMCGGPTKGECICGTCDCKPGWSGPDCSCTTDVSTCLHNEGESNLPCSGHGICQCGHCVCETTKYGRYGGLFCEDCPTCETHCKRFVDCVSIPGQSNFENCKVNASSIEYVDTIEEYHNRKAELSDSRHCHPMDAHSQCIYHYTYLFLDDGKVILLVSKEQECASAVAVTLLSSLLPLGLILFLGLLALMAYKCCITWKDAKEYKAYRECLTNESRIETNNTLYQSPWTNYQVPQKIQFEREPNVQNVHEEATNLLLLGRRRSDTEYQFPCEREHHCGITEAHVAGDCSGTMRHGGGHLTTSVLRHQPGGDNPSDGPYTAGMTYIQDSLRDPQQVGVNTRVTLVSRYSSSLDERPPKYETVFSQERGSVKGSIHPPNVSHRPNTLEVEEVELIDNPSTRMSTDHWSVASGWDTVDSSRKGATLMKHISTKHDKDEQIAPPTYQELLPVQETIVVQRRTRDPYGTITHETRSVTADVVNNVNLPNSPIYSELK